MKFKIIILSIVICLSGNLIAQEYVVPATYIPTQPKTQTQSVKSMIELPFIEDFSQAEIFYSNFEDKQVSVVKSSAILPPTIGVAMFDAIDINGLFYAENYSTSLQADKLISAPINLDYQNNKTIYMSFYYQPKGQLDLPEKRDSLVLQFYAPKQKKWTTVWSASDAKNNQKFKQVIINISDTSYQHKGFKFKFYNRISMPPGIHPSLVGNCDQWFVDYIFINKNRNPNDTIRKDIAFQYPILFKINDYQSIPYNHYKNNLDKFNINYKLNFRNNDLNNRDIDSMYIVFEQKEHLVENDTLFLGSSTLPPFNNFELDKQNINFKYAITAHDKLNFNMKTVLVTDTYDPVFNNSVIQPKVMSSIYSYDDGTAENGYGLYGDGTKFSDVAQKFNTFSADKMTGIMIYINKTFKNEQPVYFYLKVWKNNPDTHLPGELVYEEEGMELNPDKFQHFQVLKFKNPIEVSDTFYVGWMKTYTEIMNVGIDVNSTDKNYKYYISNGNWIKSGIPGVLMIRPIFGDTELKNKSLNNNIAIYPNPTTDILNIQLKQISENSILKIYNTLGQIKHQEIIYSSNHSVNIAEYPAGIYFVEIINNNKKITKKIIKTN